VWKKKVSEVRLRIIIACYCRSAVTIKVTITLISKEYYGLGSEMKKKFEKRCLLHIYTKKTRSVLFPTSKTMFVIRLCLIGV